MLVVGAGHAGITAAICAAERGCSVGVLEVAPKAMRGGNSRHTRNLRVMHEEPAAPMEGRYDFDEFMEDLLRVTAGHTDPALAEMALRESRTAPDWLRAHGVAFQRPLAGTLQLGRTNAFFMGGGKAVMNALCRAAEALGVQLVYEAKEVALQIDSGRFCGARFERAGRSCQVEAKALIVAAGGFEANLDWLAEAWGPAAAGFLVRGTPYNRGEMLRQLLDAGVRAVGDPKRCHAVAVDGNAPKFDGGICSRVDCVPFGIVVNRHGHRFSDEGEDFWPKRYASWGVLVAEQPGQVAHCIVDSQADGLFMPTVSKPLRADTLDALAQAAQLNAPTLSSTVARYNDAVRDAAFDPTRLDACATVGLDIPKSHWARRIDKPPFSAHPLRPGITFTYLGVRVDRDARMLMANGSPSENLFAAGEIMAGNILGQGYVAGMGMTIGSVFGRAAGRAAAEVARG